MSCALKILLMFLEFISQALNVLLNLVIHHFMNFIRCTLIQKFQLNLFNLILQIHTNKMT